MSEQSLNGKAAAISADADSVYDDLLAEIGDHLQAGEHERVEAIIDAHPHYAARLRRIVPAMQAMAELGTDEASAAPVSAAPRLEGRLGDFQILGELGRGGMGIVYEALELSLGRRVALKVLPFASMLDERQLARFQHEARAAALLKHPGIVSVYSVGCARGVYYYAMELIEGQSLAGLLLARKQAQTAKSQDLDAGRPNSDKPAAPSSSAETQPVAALSTEVASEDKNWWRQVAELGRQAAEALEHAHERGIVHRDIKPSNLLVGPRGHLWVADFGLAQVAGEGNLTMTGDLLGTVRYMSPEQARGERALDPRSDVYSLGATLYELLTGRPAFPTTDRQQLLRQISEEEPTPPRQLDKRIPADLETIALKAMAKGSSERYQTAAALGEDLRRFCDEQPILAKPPTARQRVGRWARRHRRLIAVGACGFLLAAVVGGALLWRERNATAAAWEQERRQRVEAQGNLDLALFALENIYNKFLSGHMAVRPDLRDLQMELVRDSVDFYARIALANRTKPVTMPKAARALTMVAQLNWLFGDPQVAEDAYQQCRSIWQELVARHPQNSDHLRELANANANYGIWLDDRGRRPEAIAVFGEAIAQFTRLRTQFRRPFESRGQEEAAWCKTALALAKSGQLAEAEEAYKTINAVMTAHLEQWPQAFDDRVELAQHYRWMAKWRLERGDLPAAARYLEQAVAHGERAVHDAPRSADVRVPLTWIYRDSISLLMLQGQTEEAKLVTAKLRALVKGLIADHPGVAEYRKLWLEIEPQLPTEAGTPGQTPTAPAADTKVEAQP